MYLPEIIRDTLIARLEATSLAANGVYRTPLGLYDGYPAMVVEYAGVDNVWSSTSSDEKKFLFNLYVVHSFTNSEESREQAEKSISDAIGELFRDVFQDPGCLSLANGWMRASNVSWGYGDGSDIPLRMAMMQVEVTVHQDRA